MAHRPGRDERGARLSRHGAPRTEGWGVVGIWTGPAGGEEDGGLGTFATLQRGHVGDLAVIPEPTACQVVCATGGALTFRLTVHGRATHASLRRTGVSAVDMLWPIWQATSRGPAG